MCCTEGERAKQLRTDELSIQEKESQSTVNQLTVQVQELLDKVSSLDDARACFDPSSSGLSHVPSQPVSIPMEYRETEARQRKLRGIHFIDLEDIESKETMKERADKVGIAHVSRHAL